MDMSVEVVLWLFVVRRLYSGTLYLEALEHDICVSYVKVCCTLTRPAIGVIWKGGGATEPYSTQH